MKKYLILLLVTISTLANAQRPVKRFIENQTDSHVNILLNAGAENGTVGAVASVTSDLSISTNAGYGVRSFEWSPAGISRNIAFSNGATPLSLRGKSCLAKAEYAGTNFAAGEIVIRVEDNGTAITADLDLVPTASDSTFQKVEIAFICPNTGTDLSIKLVNTASGKTIWLDQLWLGNDYRLGIEPPKVTAWQDFTPSWTNVGTLGSQQWKWRRVGESMEIHLRTAFTGSGPGSLVYFSIPDSKTIDWTPLNSQAQGELGNGGYYDTSVATRRGARFYANDTTSVAIVTDSLSAIIGTDIGNGDILAGTIRVPILEWKGTGTTETVTLETQGWRVEADIGGANKLFGVTLGNISSTTLIDISGLDLQTIGNSAPARIACNNAVSTGSTCSGVEQLGINVSVPYSGLYEVCSTFHNGLYTDGGIESIYRQMKIVRRSNSTNTILEEKPTNFMVGLQVVAAGPNIANRTQSSPCETFQLSAGEHTFAVGFVQVQSGTVGENSILIDRAAGANGERTSLWTVQPLTQNFPQAIALPTTRYERKFLSGNVTTNTTFLQFTGLTVGKTYEYDVKACYRVNDGAVASQIRLEIFHNASLINLFDAVMRGGGTSNERGCFAGSDIFVATASTLNFNSASASANAYFVGGSNLTYAILKELGHHTATTDF